LAGKELKGAVFGQVRRPARFSARSADLAKRQMRQVSASLKTCRNKVHCVLYPYALGRLFVALSNCHPNHPVWGQVTV